jgi:crotonobetainyl-CoA:carnitine CoA-transferase CaiB-like acyl-CoA transferase
VSAPEIAPERLESHVRRLALDIGERHVFRPGTLDRMGVGYEAVRKRNPDVIYCAMSGVGRTGPESHLPTYDAIAQAKSGLTSQLTSLGAPEPVGPPLSDQITGMYAAYGVLGALYQRMDGRGGQRLDTSMLNSARSPHLTLR